MRSRHLLRLLACGVVATILLGACDDQPTPATGQSSSRVLPDVAHPGIAALLEDLLPERSSGSVVAVRDGHIVHCAGFGDSDHEAVIPATCDTAYDVMSMTKQFTAAAIVKLEMMGRLQVRDPVGEYFRHIPTDKRDITVHQLLTHTAGLVESLGRDYERLSRRTMIVRALASPLVSAPGAEHHYSNVGYSLLAAIIEKASGMGYEEFLAEHLFSPAGMTNTGYVLPQWGLDQVAVEYDSRGAPQGRPFEHPWAADGPYWNLRGNGGLLSTARDMASWHLALEGDEVLDSGAKEEMFQPYVPEEPGGRSFYGYGWALQRTDYGMVAAHDGGNQWSCGEIVRMLDEDVMVFWVTNQCRDAAADSDFSRLAPTLTGGVVTELLDR